MAAASVAVTTFWELLEGDTDLPRLLGEGLEADAQSGSRKGVPAPKPAAHLTPVCLGGLWLGPLSLRDVYPGRAQPRGWAEGEQAGVLGR